MTAIAIDISIFGNTQDKSQEGAAIETILLIFVFNPKSTNHRNAALWIFSELFGYWVLSYLLNFFQQLTFWKKSFKNTISVSNILVQDQA